MDQEPIMIGRVLRASTTSFVLGCNKLIAEQDDFIPKFGALVKAFDAHNDTIYGLIYNVGLEDDAFVRQLVAAGLDDNPEIIEDQRRNRQVLVSVSVLVIGYGQRNQITHRLPPQPPGTLNQIYACNNAEIVRFTARHDWLRTVMNAVEAPAEQLLAIALRNAAAARPPDQRDLYLLEGARELARYLAADLPRLEGILRQVR